MMGPGDTVTTKTFQQAKRISELEAGLCVCIGALKVAAATPGAMDQQSASIVLQTAEATMWPEEQECKHDRLNREMAQGELKE